jgi:translocation and assembly module TamA
VRHPAIFLVALLAAGSARAADPQPYAVTIEATGDSAIDTTLGESAQLVTLRDKIPVPPFALIVRARGDVPRLQTTLDSFGYYLNTISITIGGHAVSDPQLLAWLDSVAPNTSVDVHVAVDTGPLFHLGTIRIDGAVPDVDRQALGLRSGDAAVAANVLDARTRLLDALEEDGYALASVDAPAVLADDANRLLDVTYKANAGPRVEIGTISFKGLKDVREEFARRVLTIRTGDRYKPSAIEKARRALMAQGVFSGVNVRAADHLSPDGRIPLTFDVEERKRHAVTIAGSYSTDLGISLSTTWSHRNLFGNAEQLNLTAAGTGLGTSTTGLGYNLSAQFIKPLFLDPDQTLELDLSGVKENLEAYDQTAQRLAGFLRRKFSDQWSASAGLSLTHDDVSQQGVDRVYELFAVPLNASYDTTGIAADLPLDPTGGLRASLVVTPTQSFGASDLTFFVLQISGSTYFDLAGDGRSVLALRGLAASVLGASAGDLPPDQRLYAGGSGTVRGFAYQSIGPEFADGNPEGAKSVDAATVEFRHRIGEDWGGAVFVDAGQASADGAPFTGTVEVGAGLGPRYYTSIGVLRLDVAVPVTHVNGGGAFEIYAGLGQAF